MAKQNLGKIRVRYAPSPTGIPHVGNIRTALFNYFLARSSKGVFILRIEDTDQARIVEGAIEAIKESLEWLGIDWDEYAVQSERLNDYRKFAQELVLKGLAKEEDGAIRFLVPKSGSVSWEDKVGSKKVEFENSEIEDFIILKKDGFPTYHLANVVDDHAMEITHVIRGEDWIPSTPKHILLYKAFGWEAPLFVHVPNVLGIDGKKLSKRKGAKSVLDFKNEGFLPEALLNYLMLLGWSPKDDREVLTREQIAESFSLEKLNSSPAIFDQKKLEWMNGEYIRISEKSKVKSQILEFDPELKEFEPDLIEKLIEPSKTRMKKLNEFKELVMPFLSPVKPNLNDDEIEFRKKLTEGLSSLSIWNKEVIGDFVSKLLEIEQKRFPYLYKVVIGQDKGLPIAEVFEILGKERVLNILK